MDKNTNRDLYSAKVIPGRGAWLELDTDKKDTVGVRVDRKRRQYVTAFLRALDIVSSDDQILEMFDGAESIRNTMERDTINDPEEALLDLYRKLRPGEPLTVESARGLVGQLFRNDKRYDLNRGGPLQGESEVPQPGALRRRNQPVAGRGHHQRH